VIKNNNGQTRLKRSVERLSRVHWLTDYSTTKMDNQSIALSLSNMQLAQETFSPGLNYKSANGQLPSDPHNKGSRNYIFRIIIRKTSKLVNVTHALL